MLPEAPGNAFRDTPKHADTPSLEGNLRFLLLGSQEIALGALPHGGDRELLVGHRVVCACALHLCWPPSCCYGNTRPGALGAKRTQGFRCSAKETPSRPGFRTGGWPHPRIGPAPQAGRGFPLGPWGTQRIPPVLTQVQLGREQMAAQTVGGESPTRVLGPSGQGLTFGKRQTRSGRGCWGRSCGGCPGGCYLCQERGGSLGGAGGNPIRLPDPQSGLQAAAIPSVLWAPPPSKAFWVRSWHSPFRSVLPSSATATPRRCGAFILPRPLNILAPQTDNRPLADRTLASVQTRPTPPAAGTHPLLWPRLL